MNATFFGDAFCKSAEETKYQACIFDPKLGDVAWCVQNECQCDKFYAWEGDGCNGAGRRHAGRRAGLRARRRDHDCRASERRKRDGG